MCCPRCSQEQISEDTRFCSRCGLPLENVALVVAHEGNLPHLAESDDNPQKRFTRSKGWKFGLVWFLVLTFLLTPIYAILEIDGLPEITAFLGFVGGLLIVLFAFGKG